jgi:hypothetical protein
MPSILFLGACPDVAPRNSTCIHALAKASAGMLWPVSRSHIWDAKACRALEKRCTLLSFSSSLMRARERKGGERERSEGKRERVRERASERERARVGGIEGGRAGERESEKERERPSKQPMRHEIFSDELHKLNRTDPCGLPEATISPWK